MADSRKRENVLVGAPDVNVSGGLLVGNKAYETDNHPTDAKTPVNEALNMVPVGFVSEDGITKTVNRETEKIKDWNKDTAIVVETAHDVTVKFTVLEAGNGEALKRLLGKDKVTVANGTVTVAELAGEMPHFSLVANLNGGEGKKGRIFVPDGQVTSVGDVSYVKQELIKYELEIECFGDADGKKFYQILEVAAPTVSSNVSDS